MSAFKLKPQVVDKVEFKNGVGKVVLTLVKTDDDKLLFIPNYGSCSLNEKEQVKLFDFIIGNL